MEEVESVAEESRPVLRDLWNIAIKVRDLEAELEFLERCGATDIVRDSVVDGSETETFAILRLGRERILLFPHVVYESELEPMPYGLTHAVFEVEDLDRVLADYATHGIHPIWGPKEVSAMSFGRRRIAFFRSPSGFVFEAEQPLEP